MDQPRPYVTAALFCQKILQEKDESLTLVRIADRVQYRVQGVGVTLPEGIRPMIDLQGLISIKSGPVVGDHVVKIIMERPDTTRREVGAWPFKFLGKDQGQNIIVNLGLGVEMDGLYWFDILFDEEMLTRVPLVVTALPEQTLEPPKA